ncbi:FMN-binding negative transcriptional regulator [Gynurincola endophyticus]|uniref:FMN-binding negative transcriptional regulator n=1 Tax=Gynurincola endophyticus TaxID=2479004 RepID=UPI000F8D944F|nr:FMN-binding negative transcriptional regulator [Gynurincola endophyticus]
MYIPNSFKFEDRQAMIDFMKKYSFATIITVKENIPVATQLPFYIQQTDEHLLLRSHFAIANEQARYIQENTSLVIFSEPHAYISPKHYDKRESVPTWDYIAIHAYGKGRILESEAEKIDLLEQTIKFYEKDYLEQWNSLSDKYKNGMIRGIVAFELEVTGLQGQQKLSQNKTQEERNRIINHLEQTGNTVEKDIAVYISKL